MEDIFKQSDNVSAATATHHNLAPFIDHCDKVHDTHIQNTKIVSTTEGISKLPDNQSETGANNNNETVNQNTDVLETIDKESGDAIKTESNSEIQSIKVMEGVKVNDPDLGATQSVEAIEAVKLIDEEKNLEPEGSVVIQSHSGDVVQSAEAVDGVKVIYQEPKVEAKDNVFIELHSDEVIEGAEVINQKPNVEASDNVEIETHSDQVSLSIKAIEEVKVIDQKSNMEAISGEVTQSAKAIQGVKLIGEETNVEANSDEITQLTEVIAGVELSDQKKNVEANSETTVEANSDEVIQLTKVIARVELIDQEINVASNSDEVTQSIKAIDGQEPYVEANSVEVTQSTKTVEGVNIIAHDTIDKVRDAVEIQLHSDEVPQSTEAIEELQIIDQEINRKIKSNSDEIPQSTEAVEGVKGTDQETVDSELKHEEISKLTSEEINNNASTSETNSIVENLSNPAGTKPKTISRHDYYSDELLRSKGFNVKSYGKTREVGNLKITAGQFRDCEVRCDGLPYDMTENELIPLFETCGKVYNLRIIQHLGVTHVTYLNEDDAENAVKILNRREVHGRQIKVERVLPDIRLFVKPIPNRATRQQMFNDFKRMTYGLVNVLLFDSPEEPGKNRGFCYLDYEDHKAAATAQRCISKKTIFGKPVVCHFANRKIFITSQTLHITNLRQDINCTDLRNYFSVYGEVSEIDKCGNFATILFRKPEDARRAAREIDKKKLGNDNVEIAFEELGPIKTVRRDKEGLTASSRKDTTTSKGFGSAPAKYPKK